MTLELKPAGKWAFICAIESKRLKISRLLAGLDSPPHGTNRYNGINVRDLHSDEVNGIRGLVLSRHLSLFEAPLIANITLGRKNLLTEDLLWVLDLVELQQEIEQFPDGWETMVQYGGKIFLPVKPFKCYWREF